VDLELVIENESAKEPLRRHPRLHGVFHMESINNPIVFQDL